MAGNGPTAATGSQATAILVFGLAFVVGFLSLVLIGIVVTIALPMLGEFAGLALVATGPLAGFLGSIARNRSWRWGYGLGLALNELAILGLQSGTNGLVAGSGLALFVVPPTIAGWLVGRFVARRFERSRARPTESQAGSAQIPLGR
jgi:hypothetical protein